MIRALHVRLLDGAFSCLHCGARYTMNLPAPINVFTAACNAFVDDHEHCTLGVAEPKDGQLDLLSGT